MGSAVGRCPELAALCSLELRSGNSAGWEILIATASNPLAIACNLEAMASTLCNPGIWAQMT